MSINEKTRETIECLQGYVDELTENLDTIFLDVISFEEQTSSVLLKIFLEQDRIIRKMRKLITRFLEIEIK